MRLKLHFVILLATMLVAISPRMVYSYVFQPYPKHTTSEILTVSAVVPVSAEFIQLVQQSSKVTLHHTKVYSGESVSGTIVAARSRSNVLAHHNILIQLRDYSHRLVSTTTATTDEVGIINFEVSIPHSFNKTVYLTISSLTFPSPITLASGLSVLVRPNPLFSYYFPPRTKSTTNLVDVLFSAWYIRVSLVFYATLFFARLNTLHVATKYLHFATHFTQQILACHTRGSPRKLAYFNCSRRR